MIQILEIGSDRRRPLNWTVANLPDFDATFVPYKWNDEQFDAAYSEHFIEHIHRFEGIRFLEEMKRVLKPGGVLRIAWPSMDFVDWLIYEAAEDDEYIEEYIRYWLALKEQHDSGPYAHFYYPPPDPLRTWKENTIRGVLHQNGEHRYLWYTNELKDMLQFLGFEDVRVVKTEESRLPEFESVEDMRHILRRLDTTIIECNKPL